MVLFLLDTLFSGSEVTGILSWLVFKQKEGTVKHDKTKTRTRQNQKKKKLFVYLELNSCCRTARLRPLIRHPPRTSNGSPSQRPQYTSASAWYARKAEGGHSPRAPHRVMMSPRHPYLFNMVTEQVSVQGESAQPACCL